MPAIGGHASVALVVGIRQKLVDKDAVHSEMDAEGAPGGVVSTVIVRVIASEVLPALSVATTPIEVAPSGNVSGIDQLPSVSAVLATAVLAYEATTE